MHATSLTERLQTRDREALAAHFKRLDGEDRRLRFGSGISDDALVEYVARIDFDRDGLFAVRDDHQHPIAVIHVAFVGMSAELGLSVLPGHRGKGMGSALFDRAVNFLRNRGTREVFVHCLSENAAMMHIARKRRMRIIPAGPETDARLRLEPPTLQTVASEWIQDFYAAWSQRPFRYSPSGK
jgi:GNAT superfamily N-acetyltransferase